MRHLQPDFATWLQTRAARMCNHLVVMFTVVLLIDIVPIVYGIGYVPTLAGACLAIFTLAIGALFAGNDAEARPVAAVAVAMRNPGLALVIAEANRAPPAVSAAIMGYKVGVALVVSGFLWWKRRQMHASGL